MLQMTKTSRSKSPLRMPEFYKYYLSLFFEIPEGGKRIPYKSRDSKFYVSHDKFRDVILDFNRMISEEIIKSAFDFKMPYKLGILGIRKREVKPRLDKNGDVMIEHIPVDWDATKKLWEKDPEAKKNKTRIRHQNDKSGNYVYSWKHYKVWKNELNRVDYRFKIYEDNKILLNKMINDPKIKLDFPHK